jgi:predicted PurR-regulated permease PerM
MSAAYANNVMLQDHGNLKRVRDGLLIFVLLCILLYIGSDVIIPMAIAVILAVLFSPLLRRLQMMGLPKAAGVALIVITTLAFILGTGILIANSLTQLATDLPRYEENLREKARSIKALTSGSRTLENAANVLQKLEAEISGNTQPGEAPKAIPVQIQDARYGALQPVAAVLTVVAHPIAQMAIMFLMLGFILYNREDLRNRLIRLVGTQDVNKTTVALDEAGSRLSQLFRMQLMVNAVTGAAVGLGLTLLGVPGGFLWGVLTILMRFVPYVGTFIAAVFPIAIALAVGEGWMTGLLTAGFIIALEFTIGHIVEPMVYGKSTGLSAFAVVLASAFWTAIWGPIGLLLATPLTLGLMVLGRHIEGLNSLAILLGNETALSAETVFYQRMLAADPIEALDQADSYVDNGRIADFITEVAIPGLALAQEDEKRQILTADQGATILATFKEFLNGTVDDSAIAVSRAGGVKLLPGRGPLNEAATHAVAAFLTLHSTPASVTTLPELLEDRSISKDDVYMCYLSTPSRAAESYYVRRFSALGHPMTLRSVSWLGARDNVIHPEKLIAVAPASASSELREATQTPEGSANDEFVLTGTLSTQLR